MTSDELRMRSERRILPSQLIQAQLRNAGLFILSVLAVFYLQPAMPIRQMDFWLPVVSLGLTTIVWAATHGRLDRAAYIDAATLALIVVCIALLRYSEPLSAVVTRSRPPDILLVVMGLAIIAALAFGASRANAKPITWAVLVALLIGLLVVLKFEPLAQALSAAMRTAQSQDVSIASAFDVRWLGFSYIAFRLIHALRERAAGKLPNVSLREFITFVVFFPALTAGPIDRVERFIKDLRAPFTFNLADTTEAARRIAYGLFKKYVVADSLVLFALNAQNATEVQGALWAWVLVYAYAFRIFFDFAGYTDIAIGIARLFGIKLPENFKNPYTKPNLTQFWNNWHITLSQWFRAYWFNPLARALRQRNLSMPFIIFVCQFSTMLLIGLWHGITLNFVAWGVWHGLGLFIHNRWGEFAKLKLAIDPARTTLQRVVNAAGVIATFHFVALGWVWFALPSIGLSLDVFRKLVGM
jgi:D-alanyl-lipoteichoic acid acyltransferase DltB (MBOAT superfamily)